MRYCLKILLAREFVHKSLFLILPGFEDCPGDGRVREDTDQVGQGQQEHCPRCVAGGEEEKMITSKVYLLSIFYSEEFFGVEIMFL